MSSKKAVEQVFWSDVSRFKKTHAELETTDAGSYQTKLCELLESLRANSRKFVISVFNYLRGHDHVAPCLILDNADHHADVFQQAVYKASKALQSDLKCLVLVSLQEAWYWRHTSPQGPLAAYQDTVFHVPAPRMRDVLQKRLEYAISKTDELLPRKRVFSFGKNLAVQPQNISRLLRKIERAFFSNDDVAVCYECLSNGDVRRGLKLFHTFIRSGHLGAEQLFFAAATDATFPLSLEELVYTIARGTRRHYAGDKSEIPNVLTLFETDRENTFARFAPCYVLQLLAARVRARSTMGEGFVPVADLGRLLEEFGVDSARTLEFLEVLWRKGLVRTYHGDPEEFSQVRGLRISGMGAYMVQKLISNRAYLECVMVDTPPAAQSTTDFIVSLLREGTPRTATNATTCLRRFLEDLQSVEAREFQRAAQSQVAPQLRKVIQGDASSQ